MNITRYSEIAKIVPFCAGCRASSDGTIRLAHRNLNTWGTLFGRSSKGLSLNAAFLCQDCDSHYSEGDGRRDSEFWEMAIARSLTFAWREGYLKFNPKGGDPDAALR